MNKKGFLKMKQRYLIFSREGFTLIEALTSVVIGAIFFAAICALIVMGTKVMDQTMAKIEVQQDLRLAMEWMTLDFQATGTTVVDVPADGQWYGQIGFRELNGLDNSILTWNSAIVRYILVPVSGLVRNDGDSQVKIAETVSQMRFRRPSGNPDIIEVVLSGEKDTLIGKIKDTLAFNVQLRNP